ncbi:MAG: hypothetical protein UY50_C0011G0008 [Parcubacteria group bacterium GW2011_GWA2_49_9]|nr:MAG: hypothetical protein UY50_C0011G0008 [Parcubacteria group bacterium GW2011_GWA2_49_9]
MPTLVFGGRYVFFVDIRMYAHPYRHALPPPRLADSARLTVAVHFSLFEDKMLKVLRSSKCSLLTSSGRRGGRVLPLLGEN